MRVETTGQAGQFTVSTSSIPERLARVVQSTGVADSLVPALWSTTGLVLSALFMLLLSNTMDDASSFFVALPG